MNSFNSALLILVCLTAQARAEFKVPELVGPVMDEAGIVRPKDAKLIQRVAELYQQAQAAQIHILTVKSLEGDTIEQASLKVVEKWKLGTAAKDNGILIFLAYRDRKLRIEVGQGLEGDVPDIVAGRIIRDTMVPYLRDDNASEAVLAGTLAVAQRINPDLLKGENISPRERSERGGVPIWKAPMIFLLLILFVLTRFGRAGRFVSRRGYGGWGGGFGGGGFGGGGWSGGGGGFSGGGSSGSW